MKATESQIQKACLETLERLKVFAWRNNTGAVRVEKRFFRFGLAGSPDILAIHPRDGTFIGIEVKSKTGKMSDSQKEFAERVRRNNAIYMVVRDVDQLVSQLKKEKVI